MVDRSGQDGHHKIEGSGCQGLHSNHTRMNPLEDDSTFGSASSPRRHSTGAIGDSSCIAESTTNNSCPERPFVMHLSSGRRVVAALEEERRRQRRQRRRQKLLKKAPPGKRVSFDNVVRAKLIPPRLEESAASSSSSSVGNESPKESGRSSSGELVAPYMMSDVLANYLSLSTVCECLSSILCPEDSAEHTKKAKRRKPKETKRLFSIRERKDAIVDILRPLSIALPKATMTRTAQPSEITLLGRPPKKTKERGDAAVDNSTLSSETPDMCSSEGSPSSCEGVPGDDVTVGGGCCPLCDNKRTTQDGPQFQCPHCRQSMHNECVAGWMEFRNHQKCPCCRKEIISDEMIGESIEMIRSTEQFAKQCQLRSASV